jgi:hypothetical protein
MGEPKRVMFTMPVPPLEMGTSWDGKSLLNWIVGQCSDEMKAALIEIRNKVGGDSFREVFELKAQELNLRVGARIVDPSGQAIETKSVYVNEQAGVEVQ